MTEHTTQPNNDLLKTLSDLEHLTMLIHQIAERAHKLEAELFTIQQDIYRSMSEKTRTEEHHE